MWLREGDDNLAVPVLRSSASWALLTTSLIIDLLGDWMGAEITSGPALRTRKARVYLLSLKQAHAYSSYELA